MSIHTRPGYMDRFYQLLSKHDNNCKKAYESVEKEHFLLYGHFKYGDYNSFRVAKHRDYKIRNIRYQ